MRLTDIHLPWPPRLSLAALIKTVAQQQLAQERAGMATQSGSTG
jgi:hypothetical protein